MARQTVFVVLVHELNEASQVLAVFTSDRGAMECVAQFMLDNPGTQISYTASFVTK